MLRYKDILVKNGNNILLMKNYVDDMLSLVENLPLGARWNGPVVTVCEMDVLEDMVNDWKNEDNTMCVLRHIASSITRCLNFISEVSTGRGCTMVIWVKAMEHQR